MLISGLWLRSLGGGLGLISATGSIMVLTRFLGKHIATEDVILGNLGMSSKLMSWYVLFYTRQIVRLDDSWTQNFAGMGEDQVNALPPELRTMVMTGATAMMNGAGANPSMMGGMNPMMDMSGMGGMIGMGMNGDMNMGGPMMQDGQGGPVAGSAPEQGGQMGLQEGFGGSAPGGGMMGIGIGSEYGMQVTRHGFDRTSDED